MDDPYSLSDDQPSKKPEPNKVTVVHGSRPGQQPPNSTRGLLIWSLLPLLVLISTVGVKQIIPAEVARWYRAAALEQWTHGEKEKARATLEDSLYWQPGSLYVSSILASWEKEEKNYAKALEHIDTCLAAVPNQASLMMDRAELLLLLDRPDEALEISKSINAQSIASGSPPRELALNSLAYLRAVANKELPEALESVDQALSIIADFETDSASVPAIVSSKVMCQDTRGFILYRMGKWEEAKAELDAAITALEGDSYSRSLLQNSDTASKSSKEESQSAPRMKAPKTPEMAHLKKGLAVIYYHRALILKELHQDEKAEADLAIVKRLYGEPDKSLF